ncbi:hypothetical protein D3C87_14270 [compost metagenome]
MKNLFFFFALFLTPTISTAQDWDHVSGGVDDIVYDMIKFDGELFVGGKFTGEVKSWDGLTWTHYPSLFGIASPLTFSIYNNTLYTGGDYPYVGSQSRVYKLVNGQWEQVGGIFDQSTWSSTKKLITYNNLLISGGRFSSIGGVPIKNIASWNGTTWNSMGSGLNDIVDFLEIHNNTLYATGLFTASGSDTTVKNIARWNGVNWERFDPGIVFTTAHALKSFQGDLLIGNVWNTINGVNMNGIARWDGINYTSMGDPAIKSVSEFWEFDGDLFIAASLFGSSPSLTQRAVMKWNGTSWIQIGSQFNEAIICLEDYDNVIYCGGQFSQPASHISRINRFLGINELNTKDKQLVKIVDLTGRETEDKPNTPLIYIYDDGTTEKIFRVE